MEIYGQEACLCAKDRCNGPNDTTEGKQIEESTTQETSTTTEIQHLQVIMSNKGEKIFFNMKSYILTLSLYILFAW